MSEAMPQKETIKELNKSNNVLPKKISISKRFIELVKKGTAIILAITTISTCIVMVSVQAAQRLTREVEESYMANEFNSYSNIVKKLYLLIKNEYNPQSPYEWFAIMRSLYRKGVFAPSVYYPSNDNETVGEPGMTTFTKNGVCRHINEFFTDVLKYIGYDAVSVNNLICFDSNISNNSIKDEIFGNHIYTMVVYDEKTVIFDYMNNLIFHKVNDKWQEIIDGKTKTELKPITDLFKNAEA